MKRKIWNIKKNSQDLKGLSKTQNISSYLCQVLLNRNIAPSDFNSFLNHDLASLHAYDLLPDIQKAAKRIHEAVKSLEKVLVVGDYDVDGVTSLAIFNEFCKEFKEQFSFYIPHRVKEGYGLNKEAVDKAKDESRTLIIAFDCGTNSIDEINLAKSYGIDVIVIDHHHPKENLNFPFAFINPKRKDSKYPFLDLSSGALSFKLLQALKKEDCFELLDLVALSVVCDVVPLKGENRVLLKEGLKLFKKNNRPAIEAICKVSRLNKENIEAHHLGFIIGPRINASGRVASAKESLEIFISQDKEKIFNIALKLEEYNRLRKGIEAGILKEAEEKLENDLFNDYAIVVAGDNWHSGVLGIVASRLTEKYYRPSFVISFDKEKGRGSARSIHSVHLMEVLEKCAGPFCTYGGHKKAAGIEIFKEGLDDFRERVNSFVKENTKPHDLVPILEIDLELPFKDIDMELVGQLEKLGPFGEDNSQPLFMAKNICKKSEPKKIGIGYSVWLYDNDTTQEALFYDKDFLEVFDCGKSVDIVYNLSRNNYHNSPRLVIRDLRFAGAEV